MTCVHCEHVSQSTALLLDVTPLSQTVHGNFDLRLMLVDCDVADGNATVAEVLWTAGGGGAAGV